MKTANQIIQEMAFRYSQGLPIDVAKSTAEALLAMDASVSNIAIKFKDMQLSDAQIRGFMTSVGVKPQSTLTLHSNLIPDNFLFQVPLGQLRFLSNPADVELYRDLGGIEIGATLAETKANLLAVLRSYSATNSYFTTADFVGNDAVMTAVLPGPLSDGYGGLTTADPQILSFESDTFGGTRAGVTPTKQPIELLPPPGEGKAYIFQLAGWEVVDTRGGAYTSPSLADGGPSLKLYFDGDPTHPTSLDDNESTMLRAGGLRGSVIWMSESSIDTQGNGNWALKIGNYGRADWQGGNAGNTISIRIYYVIVETEPFGA